MKAAFNFVRTFAFVSVTYFVGAHEDLGARVDSRRPLGRMEGTLGRKLEDVEASTQDLKWHDAANSTAKRRQRISAVAEYQINYNEAKTSYAIFFKEIISAVYTVKGANDATNMIRFFYRDNVSDADRKTSTDIGCRCWDAGKKRFHIRTGESGGKLKIMLSVFDLSVWTYDGPQNPGDRGGLGWDHGCDDLNL